MIPLNNLAFEIHFTFKTKEYCKYGSQCFISWRNKPYSWLLCNKLLSLAYLSVDLWYYFSQYDDDFSTCNNIFMPSNSSDTFTARILLWCYHQNDTWCMMGSKRTATRVIIHLVGFMYVLWELDIRKCNKNDMKFIPFKPFVIYLLDEWRTWY